jgi:hypothetical protein
MAFLLSPVHQTGGSPLARIQEIDPCELLEKNLYHQHTKGVVRLH